ncbi:hypothetical protein G6F24_016683 [Rhizopus arrhizus]|nr:hypothetical protein G6F24_016683 [Rhizopus arrhizus]
MHDRQVVVDHEVGHRVQAIRRAHLQQLRLALDARANRRVGQRCTMAHRHQEARAEEGMRFAILDALIDHLRGGHHHEQRIAVSLDLGPLVRVARILDGQVVQAEFLLQFQQDIVVGIVQAHPDEAVATGNDIADGVQADVVAFALVIVVDAVDDAGGVGRGRCGSGGGQ